MVAHTRFGITLHCIALSAVGWSQPDQPTSTTAHNSHQSCIRVVSPGDGQVMLETCRDFELQ
jgi:hypothetical protein